MKLAKKFMTLALATALGVGCATVGVSAAGSRTSAITVSAEQSAIYEVVQKIEETEGFADLQAELPAVADAFKQVNEGKMEVAGFVDVLKTLAEETTDEEVKAAIEELVEKLDGKDFVTGFDEFKVLDADKAEKNAFLGQYVFEIYILQRISMNLFDRYLNDWIYLIVCILVTFILAYNFKKLETKVDGLHVFKNFS